MTKRRTLTVVTDGSCHLPSKIGGYAAVVLDYATLEECSISGGVTCTTSQRMELLAIIEGVRAALALIGSGEPLPDLTIISDSQYAGYVVNGEWRTGKLATKMALPNRDLIEALHQILTPYTMPKGPSVTFQWVRGHSGHELNQKVDSMAVSAMRKLMAGITPSNKELPRRPYEEDPTPDSLEVAVPPARVPRYKLRRLEARPHKC